MATSMPEAHTHDGYTTVAGWIHGLYALLSAWIIVLFLISPFEGNIQEEHLLIIAVLLSIWATMGVVKFNPKWEWKNDNALQVVGEILTIWIVTEARIFLQP